MNIQCEYAEFTFKHGGIVYGCMIKNQHIPDNIELNLYGQHWNEKTNNDVRDVHFTDCDVSNVPQGLTKIFPNIRVLCINNSKLKKLSRNDLVEYIDLETFFFEQNELEFLPGNLFEGFRNLEWISFFGNRLEIIEYNLLDGLNNLKFVCFSMNLKYDKCYSIYPEYQSNATLDEIKNDLIEKFHSRHKILSDLKDSQKILVKEKRELKDATEDLEKDNKFLVEFGKKMYKDILDFKNNEKRLKDEIEELKNSGNNDGPRCSKIQHLSGLFSDIKDLLEDDEFKDFVIKVGDEKFQVHKFLLIARCPTLTEILRKDPEIESINFTDISTATFKLILNFIYTDDLPREDGINFLHLFSAAGRLKMAELQNFAATKIVDQINAENALEILNISNKYDHDWLRQQTFNQIKKIYSKVQFEDEWIKQPGRVATAIKNFDENSRES